MSALDYLSRLALALPLVLGLAVAAIYAIKRGWLRAPVTVPAGTALRLVQSLGIAPGVRLIVVEFEGRPLLLAVSRAGVTAVGTAP